MLTLLLTLSFNANIVPQIFVPEVYSNSNILPFNGDAWTENNNATYTWKFRTSYVDTMAWTSSNVKVGSYALNVSHIKSSSAMYFRLVLDKNYDLTKYDVIAYWMKATSTDISYTHRLYFNPTDTNWDVTNYLKTQYTAPPNQQNNTWVRVAVPLMCFARFGSANLTSVRQIYFEFASVGSADKTQIIIDNLRFTTYEIETSTPTSDQTKMMPLAWHSMKFMQFQRTYQSKQYTSLYAWQNIASPYTNSTALESEALGHTLFALSLAYDKSGFSFYLDEAKTLANWLLNLQENYAVGKGGFHESYFGGGLFNSIMATTTNGWVMAGLSYLYGKTNNATYKTTLDLQRNFLTGIMWNNTNNVFNKDFHNDTQTIYTYGTTYDAMADGACICGLSTYYKYVSQNATVKDRADKALNKILSVAAPWQWQYVFVSSKVESNSYSLWGAYMAYQAFNNATYKNAFLNCTKVLPARYMQSPNLNGTLGRYTSNYFWTTYALGDYLDKWGLICTLGALLLANELEPHQYFIDLVEKALFNHTRLNQNSHGAVAFDNKVIPDKQYGGTPAFLILALQLYHLNKATSLYIPISTGQITSLLSYPYRLTFTVESPSGTTSVTEVYCSDKGQPKNVSGATSWNYNSSSKILTITKLHSSSTTIIIRWRLLGDVNDDGIVDTLDLSALSEAFGSTGGSPPSANWNPDADLNKDNLVNILDLHILGKNYEKTRWTLLGDVNDDGTVDASDLSALSQAFGSTRGPPPSANWNPAANLNKDNFVNILDLYTLGKNYGEREP